MNMGGAASATVEANTCLCFVLCISVLEHQAKAGGAGFRGKNINGGGEGGAQRERDEAISDIRVKGKRRDN